MPGGDYKLCGGTAALAILVFGCAADVTEEQRYYGETAALGEGDIRTWLDIGADGAPAAIGVELTKGALVGLPEERNKTSRCFDLNENGVIDDMECEGDEERKLALPAIAEEHGMSFQWAGINFNPMGHVPENWMVPHFDFHFYTVDQERVKAIRTGSCGIYINCEDFERAIKPVPAKYVAPDYVDINAAVSEMGNHLIDSTSPQANPPFEKAEHILIYGAYDGEIIFVEPMVTLEALVNSSDECYDIKKPEAWQQSGYYPAKYCIRQDDDTYTVSLEDLEWSYAS